MDQLAKFVENFHNKKILIVGDVMLDKYIEGKVNKISSESPVPVLEITNESYTAGGAGNVASNIKSLGGDPFIVGFVGKDGEAEILRGLFSKSGINYSLEKRLKTTTKIRAIGNGQQIARLDKEEKSPKEFSKRYRNIIKKAAKESDIIVLSDYAKGTITSNLIDILYPYKSKIIANPKPINKLLYSGVNLIVSNEIETREMVPIFYEDLTELGKRLAKEINSNLLVTRGKDGMTLFTDNVVHIPTVAQQVYDVQGAGDTVISALALTLASGGSLEDAAYIGNQAAGIAVSKKGTYSVSINELEKKILGMNQKLVNLNDLKRIVNYAREADKKIVWTTGCFDLFHEGHLHSLKKAKEQGDILIAAIDSDKSVKRLKGNNRPIIPQEGRASVLSAIEYVNYVTILSSEEIPMYLSVIKPDVYVKGKGYTLSNINQNERKVVEGYGGKIFIDSGILNLSTTEIISKINRTKFN